MTQQTLTRQQAAERLCDCYAGYFDITHSPAEDAPLVAEMAFHAHTSKYVLSKKATLWEANSHEYVYLFSVPHLTREIFSACEALAYDRGMARVEPGPNHMYTYITALFLCDTCDPEARSALKRCRHYKSYRFSYWGWMDFHTGLAELSTGKTASNPSGHSAAQTLATTLFHKKLRFKRRERTYL